MSLVFDFGQGFVRACDVVCPLDTAAVTELWRLDLFSCTSSSFLCAGTLSPRVAIFCGRFSWSRQTSLSKGFFYYFHDSTTELYFRSATRQCPCYSKTKTTKYSLRSWWYCVGARLKFWRRSRVPKKGSRDEAVEIPPARKPRYF